MPNDYDYAIARDEYDRRFDPLRPKTDWIPFDGLVTQVCERCGCVPKSPDFICAGLCRTCNDAYCEEHADDPDPEPGRRYTEPYVREWTDMDWWMYAKFN